MLPILYNYNTIKKKIFTFWEMGIPPSFRFFSSLNFNYITIIELFGYNRTQQSENGKFML